MINHQMSDIAHKMQTLHDIHPIQNIASELMVTTGEGWGEEIVREKNIETHSSILAWRIPWTEIAKSRT